MPAAHVRLAVTVLAAVVWAQALDAQTMQARRVTAGPVVDGRADDAAWIAAPAETAFTVFRPTEGVAPAFRTETRIAYTDRALFVLVRAYDPHPDSIIGLLSRRDNFGPPSDLIQLYIDSYHDGRSGYEYVVNPAGVKADFLLFDDDRFDLSWDGIWDVATRVDSLGWVAEFAIPFSQLRFRAGDSTSFGIMVWRTVGRLGERASWPAYRPSRAGLVSQFGVLAGMSDLPAGARFEATPYMLTRGWNEVGSGSARMRASVTGGTDLKFGPSPNVTIDATLNPDFGQVEADPAVLNLSSIETFYPERRPFFLEGVGLFKFTLSRDPNSNEGLFYTRRIGRRPSLADAFGGGVDISETTILGAAKLTSRFRGRSSLASLSAVTNAEYGATLPGGGRPVIEPRAAYNVTRVQRDFREGRSSTGLMFTGVERDLDVLSESFLPRRAVSGGFSTQHQSRDGQYWARIWAAGTSVHGTAPAITRLQLHPVHAFQRPDDGIALDTARTTLGGYAGQIFIGKTGGVVRYGTSYRHLSSGFDPTDLGFINEADHRSWTVDFGLQSTRATSWYRVAGMSLVSITWWNSTDRIDQMLWLNGFAELPSQWMVNLRGTATQLGGTMCAQKCTRGGPAIRRDALTSLALQLVGDARRKLIPDLSAYWHSDDGGRSRTVRLTPALDWRAASNIRIMANAVAEELVNVTQFYRRFGVPTSDTTQYTIARLEQSTRAVTARVSYAATPSLSMEWYAQPFVSRGTFADVRELAMPRAASYDDRFRPYRDAAVRASPGGVRFQQFRSNLVGRWEYRPGSVVYVVWAQGRDISSSEPGGLRTWTDARDLFDVLPRNTVAVKASWWYGR